MGIVALKCNAEVVAGVLVVGEVVAVVTVGVMVVVDVMLFGM